MTEEDMALVPMLRPFKAELSGRTVITNAGGEEAATVYRLDRPWMATDHNYVIISRDDDGQASAIMVKDDEITPELAPIDTTGGLCSCGITALVLGSMFATDEDTDAEVLGRLGITLDDSAPLVPPFLPDIEDSTEAWVHLSIACERQFHNQRLLSKLKAELRAIRENEEEAEVEMITINADDPDIAAKAAALRALGVPVPEGWGEIEGDG
jgi:hypothetical protein